MNRRAPRRAPRPPASPRASTGHSERLFREALAASDARIRELIELLGDWYWEQDAELRFVNTSGPGQSRGGILAVDHIGLRRWELPRTEVVGGDWGPHIADLQARRPFRDLLLKRAVANGAARFVSVSGAPVFDAHGRFTGYRGIALDVTERVSLARRNAGLANAIENASLEMVLCDANDRIVLVNRAFRQANAERAELLAPGMRYEDYLRAGLRLGRPVEARGREEAWLVSRMAQRRSGRSSFEQQLTENRWLLVTDQVLPDGSVLTTGIDVTERKRATQALAQSEARFRDFAAGRAEWFWETDAEGRYTWVSEEAERMTGVPRSAIYGRTRAQVAAEAGVDTNGAAWRAHLATLARREPYRDFRFMRPAGDKVRWISSSGVPFYGPRGTFMGYRGSGVDVTREVALEEQTRAAGERMRQLVENLDEAMCLTDTEDRIVFANRRFVEMNEPVAYALTPGKPYAEHLRAAAALGLIAGLTQDVEAWVEERLSHRRAGGGPYERRRSDGQLLLVYDQRFEDGSVLTYGVDITARKNAETALRELNLTLEQRVQERTAELQAFSYSVSHDLRAPLRAISSFAQMVVEEEGERLSAEGRRKLAVVERNAVKMGLLMDGLLMLARVSQVEMERSAIDLHALARSVAAELRPERPAADVVVGPLPTAWGDPLLVRQALTNLIDNALKYSAKSATPRVEVGWDEAALAYYVRDNGVGFDMEYAQRLFHAFERLHTGTEFAGHGIGLAIVKRVIERHGGRVWAEAAPDAGATMRFTLPPVPGQR